MAEQPAIKIGLARSPSVAYGAHGGLYMTKDDMLLKTLDELVQAWLVTMSPIEIGSDPAKIRLLKEIREQAVGEPTPLVRDVYREVFLRDVWTGAERRAPHEGGTT